MEEENDGSKTIKVKLSRLVKSKQVKIILNEYVNDLSRIIYKRDVIFHLYVFKCVQLGIQPDISLRHINRCFNFAQPGTPNTRARRNTDVDVPLQVLASVMTTYASILDNMPTKRVDSACYSLEAASRVYLGNIKTQIKLRYNKYQYKYLRVKILEYFSTHNMTLSKHTKVGALAMYVQTAITTDGVIPDKVKNKSVNADEYISVRGSLQQLVTSLRSDTPLCAINLDRKRHKLALAIVLGKETNFPSIVTYFYKMSKHLSDAGDVKSFTPLPNVQIKRQHIMLNKRFLAVVYNKWKGSNVVITDFEANFEPYYKQMFSTHKLFRTKYRKSVPISYSTNGYDVSIIFPDPYGKKKGRRSKKKQVKSINTLIPGSKLKPGLWSDEILRMTKSQLAEYNIISIDPGNTDIFSAVTYNGGYGETFKISKGFYNEISHINRNKKKKRLLQESNPAIELAYYEMSKGARNGSLEMYLIYQVAVALNWDALWAYEFNNKIVSIKYDTYIHSRRAVSKICKLLQQKNKSHKPSLFIIGSGNGSMTISNTRNSSAHGPVKRIICELSKSVPVIIADEYKTSKTCNLCITDNLVYPKMDHRNSFKAILKKQYNIIPKTTSEYKQHVQHLRIYEVQQPYKKAVHGLCHCKNKVHKHSDGSLNRLWSRDPNSAKCILRAVIGRVTESPHSAFMRSGDGA